MQADRQTHRHIDRQTDILITILFNPNGRSNKVAGQTYKFDSAEAANTECRLTSENYIVW